MTTQRDDLGGVLGSAAARSGRGVPLMFASALPAVFGGDPLTTTTVLLVVPLAVNEMVLAVWLIVKGFNPSASAPSVDLRSGTPTSSEAGAPRKHAVR